jgi:sulfur-oxidizing protein SoxZ
MRNQLHIKVPPTAAKGEVVRLMTKLNHPMESGWRNRQDGQKVSKALIGQFVCLFNDREVFRADLESGTASDPYLSFHVRVEESGTFQFVWSGEDGTRFEKHAPIEISGGQV